MKLIVDSGSTKAAWYVASSSFMGVEFQTRGINPVRDDEASIRGVVSEARSLIEAELLYGRASSLGGDFHIGEVYFYGAGCLPEFIAPLVKALEEFFPEASLSVENDLLGAARALFGNQEGIACILGTGSNSGLYDGRSILRQTPALGWILGDEGSGAVLGRLLVGDVLKRQLPSHLCEAFFQRFGLTQASIIERVYRQQLPNRFLASLVPFLSEHIDDCSIHDFVVREFRRFLCRNVAAYGRPDLPVSFVGGVASQFSDLLRESVEAEGCRFGKVLRNPVQAMADYHR